MSNSKKSKNAIDRKTTTYNLSKLLSDTNKYSKMIKSNIDRTQKLKETSIKL